MFVIDYDTPIHIIIVDNYLEKIHGQLVMACEPL